MPSTMIQLLLLLTIALPATYFMVGAVAQWARRRLLDVPNERSSHSQPTPRGGGVAIASLTLLGLCVAPVWHAELASSTLYMCLAAMLLIAVLGFVDDLRSLPAGLRLGVQCLAAVLVLWASGLFVTNAPSAYTWVIAALTLVWLVGLTNAFNFMDGIDGIAGAQAVVAGLAWFGFSLAGGHTWLAVLSGLLVMTSLGFLGHNWPPARIFMGDVGSTFLGFSFALLPLFFAVQNPIGLDFYAWLVVGALLVWPFIFDTGYTLVARIKRRERIFEAHRSHLYQRLVKAGFPHQSVTLLYTALSGLGVMTAVLLINFATPIAWLALLFPLSVAVGLVFFVHHVEAQTADVVRQQRVERGRVRLVQPRTDHLVEQKPQVSLQADRSS
ncbi:MraY family glycosyltransferase [Candidatus Viridilinea mediisalina]|uniref:Glycosyl transferase n=1 Tax=Candidatus Viridilinea mediisalina TaxID=2024553 RepID=A0A2A6RL39_9CHLR|nr:glycosyltransferase family 4 protein [Candidatus Viridilinea mediisalina]PDW03599.1 hypothetical protein CJ255_07985 [Candidatus Viridilinea mediisalina]